MNFEWLYESNWKALLSLDEYQNQAVGTAVQLLSDKKEVAALLKKDLDNMESGISQISAEEEEIRRLYGEELYRMHPVMVLLMRLPWLIEQYRVHDIPKKILVDTLSDVKIWMDVCRRKTGHPGLLEYGWLTNHFLFKLFRLGRLQFIAQPGTTPAFAYRHKASGTVISLCPDGAMYHRNGDGAGVNGRSQDDVWQAALREENGIVVGYPIHRRGYALQEPVCLDLNEWELAYQPGDPVLDMHIAEGCPLDPAEVKKSLEAAPDFFRKHLGVSPIKAFTCSSWLLDDNIAQLQPGGNIASFQRFFCLVPHANSSDWQTRQRVFGNPDIDIAAAECRTSLQKAIQAWYAAGRYCRHAAGFILL